MIKLKKYYFFVSSYGTTKQVNNHFNLPRKYFSCGNTLKKEKKFLAYKMDEIVNWYDEFTGMNDVLSAQKRVLEEEHNFRNAQQARRNILLQLNEIQSKIKEVYAEMDCTSRGEDRYIHLVTLEHKLLKEEKLILEKFSLAEKNEREAFTSLSNCVKFSHEKERAQRERTKYWSIIGSTLGTLLGIVGTSINNHFKMKELKDLIINSSEPRLVQNVKKLSEKNEFFLNEVQVKELMNISNVIKNHDLKTEELLRKINSSLSNVEEKVKGVAYSNDSCSNHVYSVDSSNVNEKINNLTESLQKDVTSTKSLLYALMALAIIMPLFTKFSS